MHTFTIPWRVGQIGDFATEYWTAEDWQKHRDFIEARRADGTLGQPFNITLSLVENPLFDHKPNGPALSSSCFALLDLTEAEHGPAQITS